MSSSLQEPESADTSEPLVTNVTSDVVLRTNDGDIAAQQTRASPPIPTAPETVENDEDYQVRIPYNCSKLTE